MKKLIALALAFVLAGCGAIAPAATPTAAPTSTPVVLVQTVMVTVIPTQQPTVIPTDTPAPPPTPQVIVVTATGGAPAAAPAGPTNTAEANAPAAGPATSTLPANAGGQFFTNLTRSGNLFYLKCQPDTLTFGISTNNLSISEVDFFYRIEDQLSVSISGWENGGKMQSDKQGNFTIDFTAATVKPDLRSHRAWLDYEFIGINKVGDAVGRSLIIPKQIIFKIDCTD